MAYRFPLRFVTLWLSALPTLLEITLQQAFQTAAVSCFVAGHFMDGVVDSIQAVLA